MLKSLQIRRPGSMNDRMCRITTTKVRSGRRHDSNFGLRRSEPPDRFHLNLLHVARHYWQVGRTLLGRGIRPGSFAGMMFACCVHLAWSASPAGAQTPAATAETDPAVPADAGGDIWFGERGLASFYGRAHQGRRTAGGTRFDQAAMTAAHSWLPFGTRVRVTLEGSGRMVLVTITDRLRASHRVIDLSLAAARALGFVGQGIAQVSLSPG